jgi:hypothetical protein
VNQKSPAVPLMTAVFDAARARRSRVHRIALKVARIHPKAPHVDETRVLERGSAGAAAS